MLYMAQHTNQHSKITIISMFVMAFYPILAYYNVFGDQLTYASVSVILLYIGTLMGKARKIKPLPTSYYIYWIYSALQIYLIAGISGWSDYIPGGVNLVLFTMTIYTFAVNFDEELATKYLKWVFIVSSILFLIQFFSYYGGHKKISFFLPLGDKLTYAGLSYQQLVQLQSSSLLDDENRFSSIFTEPSHFAQYSLIVLAIEVFRDKNKSKLYTKFSLYTVVILFLIQSGAGLIGTLFIYVMKFIYLVLVTRKQKFYLALFILIPLFIFFANNYLNSSSGSYVSGRIQEMTDNDESQTNSTFVRLYYGWYAYGDFDSSSQLLGASRNTLSPLRENGGFFNGVTTVLCTQGLIGGLLLLLFYIQCCYRTRALSVSLALLFLLVSLIGATYLTGIMVIITTVILTPKLKNEKNESRISNSNSSI